MQLQQVNRLGRLIPQPTAVRASDSSNPLFKHGGLEERMFVAGEAVAKTHARSFSGAFDKRVVIETEHLDARVRSMAQAFDKLGMEVNGRPEVGTSSRSPISPSACVVLRPGARYQAGQEPPL